MALAAVEPKNLLGKIRTLIMGKEKPNFLTRVSVGVGFVLWVYLVSWHILTFVALMLFSTLEGTQQIRASFQRVGGRYNLGDPINLLKGHSAVQIVLYLLILVGLVLIYRKKKIGFLFYVFAGLGTVFVTFLLMGYSYLVNEVSAVDMSLLGASIAYFGIGALLFYRKKDEDKQSS
jgi:phosphatidylglycerophosphate synthase